MGVIQNQQVVINIKRTNTKMLASNVQSSQFGQFIKQNRKLTYKRHYNYRNVSQILAHLPPSPQADSNVQEKKPPFHTITFALNSSYQAGSKQHSYHARSLTPSSCKRTSPPKKINPYTKAQYLYFQQKRNQRKEQELIRKCEKIDKMLKPVHISKIQIPSNLWRNVEGTSNHRPRSQRERTMNRSKSMSRPCTNKESKNNILQKVSLEADILPWGEEINIIQHFLSKSIILYLSSISFFNVLDKMVSRVVILVFLRLFH